MSGSRTALPTNNGSQASTIRGSYMPRHPSLREPTTKDERHGSMLGRQTRAPESQYGGDARRSTRAESNYGGEDRRGDDYRGSKLGRETQYGGDTARPTRRQSTLGGEDRHGHGNGYQGSMLGRQSASGTVTGQRTRRNTLHQAAQTMEPIQEQRITRTPTRRDMDDLDAGFGAMQVRPQPGPVANMRSSTAMPAVPPTQSPYAAPQDEYITQKRFVPLTVDNIPERLVHLLSELFKVKRSKVKDWVEEGLVRVDLQKRNAGMRAPFDIEPLTAQLTAKDIEKWDQWVDRCEKNIELEKAIGFRDGEDGGRYREAMMLRESEYPRYSTMNRGLRRR